MSGPGESAYLNALPSALIATDPSLTIVYANQAAEMLFEIRAQSIIGQPLFALLPLSEKEQGMLKGVFESSELISFYERAMPLAHGQHGKANLHITPVIREGKVEQALFTIHKLAGLHALTASEWKKETTRTAGIMAAMMAHEVKNPLSGIRGAAQILKGEVNIEHQSLTDLICSETDRIRDLLDQMEIFTAGAPELSPVNIHQVLQYVISVAANGVAANVKIKESYDPSLPAVLGNRDLLVQLFLNLVKNAAEAMSGQADATITLSTSYRSGYRIQLQQGAKPVSLPLMISVEDNGPGIPQSLRERLFEPFISSKKDGRGLGLAVVAKIAADLGAVVDLQEEKGLGARFNVMLACA